VKEALTMAVDVTTEATINRPIDVVAAYSANPSNAPKWYKNIVSVELKTPLPLQSGSRMAFVARFLGKRLAYEYEVIEFVPQDRLVMRTSEGPFPMETTYTWQAAGDGATRMTLRNRGEPAGFARVGATAMATAIRRANRKDLERLRSILEGQRSPADG
jgi:uncharacterized membrane protein